MEDMESMFQKLMFKINDETINETKYSDKYREAGNTLFKVDKLFGALAQYNKALVLARNDDVRASLCYANRSAVYLKLAYFKHCLHNIELAEKNYPRGKIQKLQERREKCLELMKRSVDKAMQPFQHTSQLSFEPNPKIPSIINAIQLKEDEISGKHLITARDLKAGDVIAVVDNQWRISINDPTVNYILACYNCLKVNNGDLIPGNCKALFCSEKCLIEHQQNDTDHEDVHEIEKFYLAEPNGRPSNKCHTDYIMFYRVFMKIYDIFGSVDEMRQFVGAHGSKSSHYFDLDWSKGADDPTYYKNMLILILNDSKEAEKSQEIIATSNQRGGAIRSLGEDLLKPTNRIAKIFRDKNPANRRLIDKFVKNLFLDSHLKFELCMPHDIETSLAIFSHPAMFVLNHSCDPNITIHFEDCKRMIWTVNQPIPAGEQIFTSVENLPYYRKESESCTKSTCIPCREKWSKLMYCDSSESYIRYYEQKDPTQLSTVLKHRDECCDFINRNFTGYQTNLSVRQKIASKKEELRLIISGIGNTFPPGNFLLAQISNRLEYTIHENRVGM